MAVSDETVPKAIKGKRNYAKYVKKRELPL
jgi:hypothetical protein